MSRREITVRVDYHPGTRGLDRLLELLAFAGSEYGIRSMAVSVVDPEVVEVWENEGGR
jgi:hypothetical protein